jgi:hypothetical protein
MHVCQPEFAALEAVGQALVINSQTVQKRRMQVMNCDRIADDVVAVVVRLAVDVPALEPAAGHPE